MSKYSKPPNYWIFCMSNLKCYNKQFTLKFGNIMLFSGYDVYFVEGVQVAFCFCYVWERIDMKRRFVYLNFNVYRLLQIKIYFSHFRFWPFKLCDICWTNIYPYMNSISFLLSCSISSTIFFFTHITEKLLIIINILSSTLNFFFHTHFRQVTGY